MTLESIEKIVRECEEEIAEVKGLLADMKVCQNEKSKMLLLAAAAKKASLLLSTAPTTNPR